MDRSNFEHNWQQVKVQDIQARERGAIVSGPFGSNIGKRFFVNKGVPVIRGNNLTLGQKKFVDAGFVYVTEEKAQELRNCEAVSGDLIFTAAGTLGQVGLIPEGTMYPKYIISNKQLRVRCNRDLALPEYLYYWFSASTMREYIANQNTGSSVPLITLGTLRNLPVHLPPLPTQRRIASVLSAYDDLIENNTRRIEILEEMAQAIYREWFVNFRFPGHDKVAMMDSEFGPIPKGWRVGKIGDRFATVLGGTPSRKKPEFWEHGSVQWINSGKANEIRVISESEMITELGLKRSSAKLMPKRTTIIAITGATLGQVSLLEIEACANQSIVGVYDEQRLFSEYLYLTFEEIIDAVVQHASGGAQQHINKEIVRDVKVALPAAPIIEAFNSLVRPMFDSIANLLIRNNNLRRTRDLLLPRLISGVVAVEDLDLDLEISEVG